MSLHPEVEKMIEAGPQQIGTRDDESSHEPKIESVYETPEEFARRIAALAVEKEREAMRDAFIDVLVETDATWSAGEARNVAEEAIRRRGKP